MHGNRSGIIVIGFLVITRSALCTAAGNDPNPEVVISVENPNDLSTPELGHIQEIVTTIYERAGIALRWSGEETATPDRALTVVLTTSTDVPGVFGSDVMGRAPSPGDGTRGTIAYVFLDRAASFASAHHLAVAELLACAIAHEIGHLLLPANAHRSDSIMRGDWHPALFPPAAPGLPGFPPDQARLLRLRAAVRRGDVR